MNGTNEPTTAGASAVGAVGRVQQNAHAAGGAANRNSCSSVARLRIKSLARSCSSQHLTSCPHSCNATIIDSLPSHWDIFGLSKIVV